MKKIMIFAMIAAATSFGCARVNVGGSKEPIKVDIAMRLDIYQHVQKDIDSIENIVVGDKTKPKKKVGNQSFWDCLQLNAYAQEGLSPDVEQAALRRKDRRDILSSWEAKAVVGENKAGLVEVRNAGLADSSVDGLVKAENADRVLIYRSLAQKYGETLEQIQKVYAEKLVDQAPSGTPIEVLSGSANAYEWKVK
ncbi:MAG: DUF1318 domain-containing protein [Nanoarchaeota archaeon]